MPGKILKVNVKKGQEVKKGEILVVLEAMKMEHSIKAPREGVVLDLFCQIGEQVDGGIELVSLSTEKE